MLSLYNIVHLRLYLSYGISKNQSYIFVSWLLWGIFPIKQDSKSYIMCFFYYMHNYTEKNTKTITNNDI